LFEEAKEEKEQTKEPKEEENWTRENNSSPGGCERTKCLTRG
jgi:hypothetical protein